MTGTVTSGLTGQPTTIGSQRMTLTLVQPATGPDTIQLSGPVPEEGAVISIHGNLALPSGTLTSTSIAPFASVSTISGKSSFSYVVTHPAWAPSTAYTLGKEILDPSGNVQDRLPPHIPLGRRSWTRLGTCRRRRPSGPAGPRLRCGARPLERPPVTTRWCGRAKDPS